MATEGRDTLQTVIELVRSSQRLPPDEPLDATSFLIERGLALDSVALLELVLAIEDRFGFRIGEEELVLANFETLACVGALIDRKLAASSAHRA